MSQTELILEVEHQLKDLLGSNKKLEASGVVKANGYFYVVFDNFSKIAKIPTKLDKGKKNFSWVNEKGGKHGFEDIAYDDKKKIFYTVVEAVKRKGYKNHFPKIYEFDSNFTLLQKSWVEVPFGSKNKGLEGLEHIRRDGKDYLFGLCEGNFCQGKGGKGGGGRIKVLEKSGKKWVEVATITLPLTLDFKDYASITLDGNRMAVVSQENSELWIGNFQPETWPETGKGQIYSFPQHDGKTIYGNVEGACWIGKNKLVVVSDKKKKTQPKRYEDKDQSIHIFELP